MIDGGIWTWKDTDLEGYGLAGDTDLEGYRHRRIWTCGGYGPGGI